MSTSELFPSRWHWPAFLVCNLLAALLMASWLWQPTRLLWDALDLQAFHLLNAPLAASSAWAHVWAVGNMRPFDMAVGLIMLGLLIRADWVFSGVQVRRAFFTFIAILLLLLVIRIGFVEILKAIHWQRASPSLTVPDAVRLTTLFPGWEDQWYMKDSSKLSFPGDHASVLLIWAMVVSVYARGRSLLVVWALTTLFMLPRLVSGAHSMSDDFVGGLFISLLAFGWGYCTPYAAMAGAFAERVAAPMLHILGRVPILNRLSLVAGR